MRFRNYRNSFNRKNRIYSDEDLLEMKLATIFDNENDIIAQNRDIGIPTRSELESSQNTLWVEPSIDEYGNEVKGHWQSLPNTLPPINTDGAYELKAEYNQPLQNLEQNTQEQKQNDIMADLKAKYPDNKLISDAVMYAKPLNPLQKGIQNIKNTIGKYEGLTPKAAVQKAAAKIPIWKSSAKEYYQHSLKRADGEEPTDFMKQNNDFRKLDEISDPELKQIYIEKAAKMHGLDVNDPATYDAIKNTEIVIPKIDSQLYSQIKNSEDFQKWVAENYENIKNNTNQNTSIEFAPDLRHYNKLDLFATIHNSDLKNSKINEDGSFSTTAIDPYNYETWEKRHYKDSKSMGDLFKIFAHNRIIPTNNRAKEQQDLGQLDPYILSSPIHLTKEELEEILRKYGRIK